MKKRIISLLMALLMLTSLLPTAVWAEGEAPEQTAAAVMDDGGAEQEPAAPETPETPVEPEQPAEPEQSTEPKAAAEPEADAEPEDNGIALYSAASGSCGNNLTWTLDNGTLTISGTGAMWSWDDGWDGFCDELSYTQYSQITTIEVESGVTSIGRNAFSWLPSLTSVSIPTSVKTIGFDAFTDSDQLTVIYYAGKLAQWKKIDGSSAITLPLKTVVHCSNGEILPPTSGKCGTKVTYTISDDGVLTISGTGAMANYTYKDNDSSNCPWHSVRWAIKKVVIENGVTSIGDFAFAFDISLADVTIPGSVTSIGNRAFMGTPLSSVVIPEGVKTIGENAFWRCTSLQTVTVPASTTELGNHAFDTGEYYDGSYHTQLTDIYYGGSRQQWYNAGGGDAAPMVVTVHFNGTTGNIIDGGQCGDNAFWKLDKDYTLTISGTGAMWDYPTSEDDSWWMDWALPWKSYEAISRIVVAEGITHIGAYAFCYTVNATALSLPDSLTTIGQDAFCCYGGTEIVVPDNVTEIGYYAFNTCNNLQTITLPAGLREIGPCFIECDALKTINFGGTMEQWLVCGGGESTFPVTAKVTCAKGGTLREGGKCGDNLTWTLDSSGKLTISGTGDMENYASETSRGTDPAPWAYASSMIRSVEIGSGVTSIGSYALVDTNITSLTIPGSVTTIGNYGAYHNRYLAELTLNEGLRSIGKGAFSWSKQLTTVTIPDGVTTIGEEAFAHCWAWLPKADTYIGLSTVSIPGSVTSIGKNAFDDNQELLTTVNFDGTQEQWNAAGGKNAGVPSSATFHCVKVAASGKCGTGVKWSLASNGVLTISGRGAVTQIPWQKEKVNEVVVFEGVTSLCKDAFTRQPVTRVTLPDSLTAIGTMAFAGCQMEELCLPRNLKTVGVEAFAGCAKLKYLDMDENCAVALGDMAFEECSALEAVHLSANIKLGEGVFVGCGNLEEVLFEGSGKQWLDLRSGLNFHVVTLECRGGGFGSGKCGDNLTWELDGSGLLTISGTGRMYDYQDTEDDTPEGPNSPWTFTADGTFLTPYIHEIKINYGVTHIGDTAFKYCHYVDDITIPGSVTSIGESAFRRCDILRNVTIPNTVTSIGANAFLNDDRLYAIYFSGSKEQWSNLNPSSLGLSEGFTAAGGYANVTFVKLGVIVTDGDTPDVTDVASLYDHLTGQADTAYTPRQELSADVNRDGTLDVYDLQLLYEAVAQGTEL